MSLKKLSILSVCTVFAIQLVLGFSVYFLLPSWAERGQFGDVFGASNSFFSGLALSAVAYAILLQSEELSLQRQELKSTREELARAAKAQESTEKAVHLQATIAGMSAAINGTLTMLEHLRRERDKLGNVTVLPYDHEKSQQSRCLDERIEQLISKADQLYRDIINLGEKI